MNAVRTMTTVFAVLAVASSGASASELTAQQYICVLEGSQAFPVPSQYPAVGNGFFTLDGANALSFTVFECHGVLSGATAVHIHGPALQTDLGPVIATLTPNQYGVYTGVLGTLTAQQLRDLNCGLWYVDIHTAADPFPWGDIRGRIRGDWGWPWAAPCNLPVEQSTWGRVKSLYR